MSTIFRRFSLAILALAVALGVNYASAAWSNPSTTPPGGNIDVPVNVGGGGASPYTQVKSGAFAVTNNITSFSIYSGTNSTSGPFNFVVSTAGDVTAHSFLYSSDKNLKTNIQTLDPQTSLQKLLSLNGVSFNWKSNGAASDGVVAQDVEQVYPELVNTDASTGLKSVNYAALIGPMLQALKAQQTEIDTLKAEVEALKSR